MEYLLALDAGTTSSRAVVIDSHGSILAVAQREFKQYFPEAGSVEHDPEEIWSTQYAVVHEAVAKANLKFSQIAGIGIANQRETTIVWSRKTSKPICRAIVWQDRRTTPICEKLRAENREPIFRKKTGLLLDPYFSGTKIRWILDHVPSARKLAELGDLAFGTVDSWLVWKLTEGKQHITDVSNASRTLLFNIHTLEWDEELLDLLQIPRSILPEVRTSSEIYGQTGPHIFPTPISIAGIAGDQQAALFGQGCFEEGKAKSTYGTGCFLLLNTGNQPVASKQQLISTVAWKIKKETHYALEGSVFIAGAAIQWLRDNLKIIQKSSEVDTLAASVPDSGGVYFVPAFAGLGAPYWDPHARGTILGLTRGSNRGHIARATLEAIAFSAADVLRAMEEDAGFKLKELHVDGGAAVSDLLMQIQADLIQTPVLRPKNLELTALGAAMLAGLGIGLWKEPKELMTTWQLDREFLPTRTPEQIQKSLLTWKRAVERAKNWETS